MLESWGRRFRHGILHVKQEDRGFRRARILNRAIYRSRFPRLGFADMDCLPHRRYLENYARYLAPGVAITGRRVHVARDAAPAVEEILKSGLGLGPLRLVWLWGTGRARVIEHGVVLPVLYESKFDALLGSNFGLCRGDLEEVNGFNEEFRGYGWEDTDLDKRLKRNGVRVRNLRNKVVQYHLQHAQRSEENEGNREVIERSEAKGAIRAAIGLGEIEAGDHESRCYRGEREGV